MYDANSPILGPGYASHTDIDAWFTQHGYCPPGLGMAIITACSTEGVNSDLVASQCAIESACWTSAIAVQKNNPAGIGAENDDPFGKAVTFPSVSAGIQGQVYHLLTYVKGAGYWGQFDPRYAAVKAAGWLGVVHVLSDLDGRWAYPGVGYGAQIAQRANDLVAHSQGTSGGSMPTPYAQYISGLTDIRAQLPTSTAGDHGPNDRRAMSDKRGLVVHYSGPPNPKRDDPMYMMKMEAQYHVDKNWCKDGQSPCYGDGYMYHVVIDDNGTKYLCRDLESVLWHCGAWPQNAIALSVHVLIGDGQQATAAQLKALTAVVDDWRKSTSTPMAEVWGHQELSSTSCPGSLMKDFVLPYRAGTVGGTTVTDGMFFPETKHFVGNAFWDYWQAHGGLMQYGLPLTDEIQESGLTVQYFERAIFEFHPENQDPFRVLLRRLGADAAKAAGYQGVGI